MAGGDAQTTTAFMSRRSTLYVHAYAVDQVDVCTNKWDIRNVIGHHYALHVVHIYALTCTIYARNVVYGSHDPRTSYMIVLLTCYSSYESSHYNVLYLGTHTCMIICVGYAIFS